MAVSPSKTISTPKNKEKQKQKHVDSPQHVKRNKSPGVRIIGGRIYDSENGKSCHQCRQKTIDFVATCKNQRDMKPSCTIKFCHKCLWNRYGEKAEEMAVLVDWKCPKCRGICNCSFCMKKKGHQPTGILVHTAKATGFSSVSEMLHVNGPENVGPSPKKRTLNKDPVVVVVASPKTRKVGNRQSSIRISDSNLQPMPLTSSNSDGKKIGKNKGKQLLQENNSNNNVGINCSQTEKKRSKKFHTSQETSTNPTKKEIKNKRDGGGQMKISKKSRISNKFTLNQVKKEEIAERDGSCCQSEKIDNSEKISMELINKGKKYERDQLMSSCNDNNGDTDNSETEFCKLDNGMKTHNTEFDAHMSPLPQCIDLMTVAGIDLPAEDIGHALQFLEFCNAFGQVLNLKKGQPEAVLQELTRGSSRSRGKYSLIIHLHKQLLSFIQKEAGEGYLLSPRSSRKSWLQALGKCISESQCAPRELPLCCFDRAGDGYEKLDPSKKLRLLNFLCDETLCTRHLRVWIDAPKSSKFVEREKEAKEKILAARYKERRLKQEMQNEVAKAILLKNGAPLSISEHEDLVSKIKIEAAKAHEGTLEAIDVVPKKKQTSDAVRTEPVLLEGNGQAFWRLRGCSAEPNILLQDIGSWDSVTTEDKWFTYDVEQKNTVENYISSLRRKRLRTEAVQEPLSLGEVKQV